MGCQDLSMKALCSVHMVPLKSSFCRTFPLFPLGKKYCSGLLMHNSLPIKVNFFSLSDIHIKIK